MNLTPRQSEVASAIRDYLYLNGYSPTLQEIADQLGVRKVAIFEHVNQLEKKGVVIRDPYKCRSIKMVAGQLPDETRGSKIPVLATIGGGSHLECTPDMEQFDLVLEFGGEGVYGLRVRGDGFENESISHGDCLIVRPRADGTKPRHGQLVLTVSGGNVVSLIRYAPPAYVGGIVIGVIRDRTRDMDG